MSSPETEASPRRTLFAVLEEATAKYGPLPAMHQPIRGKGQLHYRAWTWTEYRDAAREIACGLRTIGVGKGDIVSLHSETRAEFYLADLGVMGNGSVAAALYTSLPPADHVKTVAASEPKAMFVEDVKSLISLRQAGVGVPGMTWIVLDGEADETSITLERLRQYGREALGSDPDMFERVQSEISPDDYAILYMTSGATGEPKMGLATHSALVANLDMGPHVLPLGTSDSTLVFLPSAHIAQRIVIELLPIRTGTPVWFSEGLAKMPAELKTVRPTFLLAPPRVWERIYSSVAAEVRKRPAFAQKLFYGALGLGLRAARIRNEGKPVPGWLQTALNLADKAVFSKVRERLGGRLKIAASGAAPLGKELAQFFEAIGLPLVEGYGLTEGGVATLNPIERPKAGSIGKAMPGVELKLLEDGELLIKSPCLFSGYYKDPESTAAVLKNGWLHTGDIAEFDKEGYVFITGRKKELIVSSNGKKIFPSRIESLFKVEPLVNQVILIGDRQPYVTALLTVNAAVAESIKGMETMKGAGMREIVQAKPVLEELDRVVKRINKQLASFEQIRRFRILDREFSIEEGELTPTMKVRRKQVLENYKAQVSELYLGKEEMA
ncbi:MAG: long-chain fatty acid--CoA ligase [Bryobacteraceae bacterium]|nr:long-chain fatty acid--CoA ligase [Bryobacteraceae bacterium]